MKTKAWIVLLAAVLICCIAAALLFFPGPQATHARVLSGGQLIATLDLSRDCSFPVEYEGGVNVVTVRDGRIAVTEADCPDHTCMNMGWRSSGGPIVCLPNSLVIEFLTDTGVDGAAG